jgi:predicted amidophosphoribosyltransferase
VKPTDLAAAKEIDRVQWLRGAPEQAASFNYEEQESKGVCPACTTPVPEGSAECPECGLMVNPDAELVLCPKCDAEVGHDDSKCPKCGVEFE